jgi:hypothetical protein
VALSETTISRILRPGKLISQAIPGLEMPCSDLILTCKWLNAASPSGSFIQEKTNAHIKI